MLAFPRCILACLIGASVLAGCAHQPIGTFERPDYQAVAVASARHELAFQPGSTLLAPGERERLNAFLAGLEPAMSDDIMLTFVPSAAPELDQARVLAVARAIRLGGLPRAPRVRSRDFGRIDHRYDVVLIDALGRQEIVVLCPTPYEDPHFPRIGCANEANRAAMAARPDELVQPLALSNGNAEVAGRAVARYRTGQVIPPRPLAVGAFITSN